MKNPLTVVPARSGPIAAESTRTRFVNLRVLTLLTVTPLVVQGQISLSSVTSTPTQAIISYTSPVNQPCTLQVADLNRQITIVSAAGGPTVTVTTAAPHGLLPNAVVYMQNSVAGWNGWQTINSVPTATTFTFTNALSGSAAGGAVGVLVDDVNPVLFPGANQDSRPGNTSNQLQRVFVVGQRYAQFASDGNRYSRALQANSLHHFTLTCGTQTFDQQFQTQNIPLGDTYNEGPLADRNNPGQYAYPTIQWSNPNQTLIDPLSGVRSFRATSPVGTPSAVQNFVAPGLISTTWVNVLAPLTNTGATATFLGPCLLGNCPLYLKAANLSLPGGGSYTAPGSSLDWFQVTITQASIGLCTGNDCKIEACLTVNGVSCASNNVETALNGTPGTYTIGTRNLMDLWQGSGPPSISRVDASTAAGTVSYVAATKQATVVTGTPFNIRWSAGSQITIAGVTYTIASVQNERQLTLASGPNSNLTGAAYTASNFGVLIWKKTATLNLVSIGFATYTYGSTPMPSWGAAADNPCSPVVTVAGVQGYNCFVASELYWFAANGSDVRDLGLVALTYNGNYPDGWQCGTSNGPYQFDPQNGNVWYCTAPLLFDETRQTLLKVQYTGSQTRYTPGQRLPDCSLNGGIQPCLTVTVMQPNKNQSISQVAPLFNPDYAASGFQAVYWNFLGVSPDGDIGFQAQGPRQDDPGWTFVFSLGDRTPAGTDANSVKIVAGASSYRKAPLSWCSIHDELSPSGGWIETFSNDLSYVGPTGTYTMTLNNGMTLKDTAGVSGGLNNCPPNPFGVTSPCSAVVVKGPPVRQSDGGFLQNVQVGDLMDIDSEVVRIVSVNNPTLMTVQRGYLGTLQAHTNTTFTMACGTRNIQDAAIGLWNYRQDPYGANTNWTTVVADSVSFSGHEYLGGGIPGPAATVVSGGATYNMGEALCPAAQGGNCNQVRMGYMSTALNSPVTAIALDPPFAGHFGVGAPIQVDNHPGPCFDGWCMDARPMEGGTTLTVAQAYKPFTQVMGQLWKVSGTQTILNRKFLATMAYVGRTPLVDVSGPDSVLGAGAQNSYEYCYAFLAGECQPGSAVGDLFVNAPYVSYPYCYAPGIAQQDDDINAICIGDLGAYTGNVVQSGFMQQDVVGAGLRRLGPNYSKWNQQDTYWNTDAVPSGLLSLSQVRWLDGVRFEDLLNIPPPYPTQDGVIRYTFLPVPVTVTPPQGMGAQSAVIAFGYAENGNPANYYCTSRQESCIAAAAGINPATPFYFATSESYSGVPCSQTCTITIPALSQHVVYYQVTYLGASGAVVGTSGLQVAATP